MPEPVTGVSAVAANTTPSPVKLTDVTVPRPIPAGRSAAAKPETSGPRLNPSTVPQVRRSWPD